ncbi:hypothetical protein X734_31695 [Mesorhizobium sp. L2C084A000]|nr:hypothetical protein X734_31695 [Mesorhizobium sp. L2C084A000]
MPAGLVAASFLMTMPYSVSMNEACNHLWIGMINPRKLMLEAS